MSWISNIGDEIGISPEVVQKGVVGITRGQATLLLKRMNEYKQGLGAANGGRTMFEHAIEYARTELPIVVEETPPDTPATKQEADVKPENNSDAFAEFVGSISAAIVKSEA